jgi:hypothetical protein
LTIMMLFNLTDLQKCKLSGIYSVKTRLIPCK